MNEDNKCVGSKSIQEQYKEIAERKTDELTNEQRLKYLIQYHHNLSLQYASMRGLSKKSLEHLDEIEREIDQLLSLKGGS